MEDDAHSFFLFKGGFLLFCPLVTIFNLKNESSITNTKT